MITETITHATLRELSDSGAVSQPSAVAIGARWALVVSYGNTQKMLAARNSRQVRSWASLDSLAKYLAGLGIYEFHTNARDFDPGQKILKRPDRAEALRQAHQAAEYDRWFREQVNEALEEADGADAVWLTGDELFGDLEKRIQTKHGKRQA